ncbi:MAG: OmpA family protein, partial [Endomicrobium sp.]|nr:OmpA family protein [Endomicrobium sp.]
AISSAYPIPQAEESKDEIPLYGGVPAGRGGAVAVDAVNPEDNSDYAPLRLIVAKFSQKEYKVNAQSQRILKVLAEEIKKSRYMRVIVISKSSRSVRMELAARRAKSVYDELYKNGVNIDRMEYVDIGLEEVSKNLGLNPSDFKTNRVEVIVEYLR